MNFSSVCPPHFAKFRRHVIRLETRLQRTHHHLCPFFELDWTFSRGLRGRTKGRRDVTYRRTRRSRAAVCRPSCTGPPSSSVRSLSHRRSRFCAAELQHETIHPAFIIGSSSLPREIFWQSWMMVAIWISRRVS